MLSTSAQTNQFEQLSIQSSKQLIIVNDAKFMNKLTISILLKQTSSHVADGITNNLLLTGQYRIPQNSGGKMGKFRGTVQNSTVHGSLWSLLVSLLVCSDHGPWLILWVVAFLSQPSAGWRHKLLCL